jgi:hypothetical protein
MLGSLSVFDVSFSVSSLDEASDCRLYAARKTWAYRPSPSIYVGAILNRKLTSSVAAGSGGLHDDSSSVDNDGDWCNGDRGS